MKPAFALFAFLMLPCTAFAGPIEFLKVRVANVSNLKQVTFEATVEDEVLANGFCFITTDSFQDSLKSILPSEQVSKLTGFRDKTKIRGFQKYDAYCGLTTGSKVKKNGLLSGRVRDSIRGRVFLATYENKQQIEVVRDATACIFVRLARSCFKTIRANVQTEEDNDGKVTVTGAVTGLAGCYEIFERRGELSKSIVIYVGSVPEEIEQQANSKGRNAGNENQTCDERGFRS